MCSLLRLAHPCERNHNVVKQQTSPPSGTTEPPPFPPIPPTEGAPFFSCPFLGPSLLRLHHDLEHVLDRALELCLDALVGQPLEDLPRVSDDVRDLVLAVARDPAQPPRAQQAVSYTHLTLPTIYSV